MMLSTLLADSGGMFAEVPQFLRPVSRLSLIKWGFEARAAVAPRRRRTRAASCTESHGALRLP